MDQLPGRGRNGPMKNMPMLPMDDLNWPICSTITNSLPVLRTAARSRLCQSAQFMSTKPVIYDNQGSNAGTDISRFEIQTANLTDFLDCDPVTAARSPATFSADDPPAGMVYFDHRAKPNQHH